MDFMEISKKRRTVRKFAQRPVEAEKVEKILEAYLDIPDIRK